MLFKSRSSSAAVQKYCDLLNRVLNTTITKARISARPAPSGIVDVRLRQGGIPQVRLASPRYGALYLVLGQQLRVSNVERGLFRLHTVRYRYALAADIDTDALLRWEYAQPRGAHDRWCAHHVQGVARVAFPEDTVSLNDLHAPTGRVGVEDIARFCIADLGIRPLSRGWHEILGAPTQ